MPLDQIAHIANDSVVRNTVSKNVKRTLRKVAEEEQCPPVET